MGWSKLAGKQSWEKKCSQAACELLREDMGTDALQSSDRCGRLQGTQVSLTSKGLPGWCCSHREVGASVLCLQVKCIILQVLKGLQYLHENYIIHRWEQRGEHSGKGDTGGRGWWEGAC